MTSARSIAEQRHGSPLEHLLHRTMGFEHRGVSMGTGGGVRIGNRDHAKRLPGLDAGAVVRRGVDPRERIVERVVRVRVPVRPPIHRNRNDVPRWIENDLRHAEDTLDASLEHAEATALELMSFCRRLGVPFGINVESVSIRRVEIEASVRLAEGLRGKLAR